MDTAKPYKQLEQFLTKDAKAIDLECCIGFIPDVIPHNSIHSLYHHKLSSWTLVLQDFNKSCTKVYAKGDRFFSRHLFFTMVFEPLLQYKQLQKNHITLHASAVSHNNKAFVFSGDACVGKTSALMHFLSKGDKYLADDQTMIDAASLNVAPYPLPIGVDVKLAIKTHLTLSAINKLRLFRHAIINFVFLKYTHLTTNIPVDQLKFNDMPIVVGKSTLLHKIFILTTGDLSIRQLSQKEARSMLWKNKIGSRSKLPALIYYAAEYKKIDPNFQLWHKFNEYASSLTQAVPVYRVSFMKYQFASALALIEQEMNNEMKVVDCPNCRSHEAALTPAHSLITGRRTYIGYCAVCNHVWE